MGLSLITLLLLLATNLLWIVNGLPNVLDRIQRNNNVHTSSSSQTSLWVLGCNISSDCVPNEYSIYDIDPDFISCFHNVCLCMMCFTADPMTGICQLNDCFGLDLFDGPVGYCFDNRPSQKTAFLLSFFLSPVGAANFHIGQWKLGVIQISLSVFLLILIIWCCCTSCRIPDEDSNHWCAYIFFVIFTTVLVIIVITIILTWWLADLICFGLNQRQNGDGCNLKADL